MPHIEKVHIIKQGTKIFMDIQHWPQNKSKLVKAFSYYSRVSMQNAEFSNVRKPRITINQTWKEQ